MMALSSNRISRLPAALLTGLEADRPTEPPLPVLFVATDSNELSVWDGDEWIEVAAIGTPASGGFQWIEDKAGTPTIVRLRARWNATASRWGLYIEDLGAA